MIIIASKNGQLGNRLYIYAFFIAFALENNLAVINPAFHNYSRFFQTTSKDSFCRFPPKSPFILGSKATRALYYFFYLLGKVKVKCKYLQTVQLGWSDIFFLDSPEIYTSIKQSQIVVFQGYVLGVRFLDKSNFVKYADKIRSYFTPLEKHQHNISVLINKLRESCEVLVGVHIRHGDYKDYEGGKYFYTLDNYTKIMQNVKNLFFNKKVVFLICSNAQHDENTFSNFNFAFGNNHIIEDMYSLAKCDYIIGPPSTYNTWSSFYGNVPLYKIVNPDAVISLDSFRICRIPLIWDKPE